MRIIPAIDLIEGNCVRLSKGNYNTKKVYSKNPLEVAKMFEAHGVTYLHLVDLDGAKSKKITNHKVLESIAVKTSLKIDFSGGLRSIDDLRIAFESGASQIVSGSTAVKYPETFESWFKMYGDSKIILGADVKEGKIATDGWLKTSNYDLIKFIQSFTNKGVRYIICTDISRDGMLSGPAFELYTDVINKIKNIKLIASGGISNIDDILKLASIGCEGAIIGKAIYENKISLKQLEYFITKKNG